jgi:hypothetical protein
MPDVKMVVNKERWKEFSEEEKSWITYDTLQDINKRVKKLENRKFLDGAKSFAGGLIGGAAAIIGIKLGGFD